MTDRAAVGVSSWRVVWDTGERQEPALEASDAHNVSAATGARGTRVVLAGYLAEPNGPSAAAEVAAGFESSGEAALEGLRGAYSLALWSPSEHRLLLARDHLGLAPCFYALERGRLVASPHLDDVLAARDQAPRFDGRMVAENALGITTSAALTRSLYEDVGRLAPGHIGAVTSRGLTARAYWKLPTRVGEVAENDVQERFEETLTSAVRRCVVAGADAIALSGGYDSVGIAVLAADARGPDAPLMACSLRFGESPSDESGVQRAVADYLGMPWVAEEVRDASTPNLIEASLAESAESPIPIPGMWRAPYSRLLDQARSRGARGLCFGNGGDELLSVAPAYGADLLLSGRLREHLAALRAWVRTEGGMANLRLRDLAFFAGLRPALVEVASRVLGHAPRAEQRLRERRWERRLSRFLDDRERAHAIAADLASVRQRLGGRTCYARALGSDRVAAMYATEFEVFFLWGFAHGITPMMPYFDRDLVDLLVGLPPSVLIADGYQKTPLRRLVGARLPDLGVRRAKVDFTALLHQTLRRDGPLVWGRLGGIPALAMHAGLSPDRVAASVRAYLAGDTDDWVTTWQILAAESWLQARG